MKECLLSAAPANRRIRATRSASSGLGCIAVGVQGGARLLLVFQGISMVPLRTSFRLLTKWVERFRQWTIASLAYGNHISHRMAIEPKLEVSYRVVCNSVDCFPIGRCDFDVDFGKHGKYRRKYGKWYLKLVDAVKDTRCSAALRN